MGFLELNHITKRFANFTAVENFNLEVEKGEFVSFLGPSGCGKTTTLRMIAGFETPTSGKIIINGEDVTFRAPNQRKIGMVFQSYALFPNMTVADNIGFGLKVARKPAAEIKERVKEMLLLIHMEEFADRYPYQISGGQQQRVALARAIAIRPTLLLLDEPLSALDAKIRVELRNEIRAIQQKLGITTIYVTHDQEEALSLSDRVVVMNKARMEQVGAPFEIYNFPQTPFVASFVGTLSILNAEVVNPAQGLLKVDGQEFYGPGGLEARPGDILRIALRPEIVSLKETAADMNRMNVQVQTITFLGSVVRVQVKLETSRMFFDLFNNPSLQLPREGENLTIYFPKSACLVLGK